MNKLEFKPTIFTITTIDGMDNIRSWPLITLDGYTPNESIYFFKNGLI